MRRWWIVLFLAAAPATADDAAALVERLDADDDTARDALLALGDAAVPALVDGLDGKNWSQRYRRLTVLRALGPPARAALPGLRRRFERTGDRLVAEVVTRIDPTAEWVVPSLVARMPREPDDDDLIYSLARVGRRADAAIPHLLAAAEVAKYHRPDALWAAYLAGCDPDVVVTRLRGLLATDERGHAVELLGAIGAAARAAIPDLLSAVPKTEPNSFARGDLVQAIAEIGIDAEHLPLADTWLCGDDAALRACGVAALASVQPFTEDHFDRLTGMLEDPDALVRGTAILGLSRLDDERAVPFFIRACKDENDVAFQAVQRLRPHIERPDVQDALRELVRRGDGWSAPLHAADILGEARVAAAVPDIAGALASDNPYIQSAAALALSRLPAKSAAPALRKLLTDEVAGPSAVVALYRLTGETHFAHLRRHLEREPDQVRALYELGPAAREFLPFLKRRLARADPWNAVPLILSIHAVDGDTTAAVRRLMLRAAIDAEDGLGGGLDSVEALGTLGPPAKEAVPLLRILLAEARTGAQVRIVRWALAEIEG